ncbi:MAG: hypothetical protein Aurels2KO_38240 [Aureliella sp.]
MYLQTLQPLASPPGSFEADLMKVTGNAKAPFVRRKNCHRANSIGAVVIGRNEGERLQRCLASVTRSGAPVAYVDSDSSDNSLQVASKYEASVVRLDIANGFSAAKARNAGARELGRNVSSAGYIQFVDGDCELDEGWIEQATEFLDSNAEYAVVCGRRREQFPDASIYNTLCDIEWDTPIGETLSCGGDALVRVDAFNAVGGFNEAIIAGEEPELCVRLRQAGWKVFRLNAEMTSHDANMHRFGQWWNRAKRAGYAYAQGAALHGLSQERHWLRETLRCWVWAFLIPVLAVCLFCMFGSIALVFLCLYPLSWLKTFVSAKSRMSTHRAAIWATSCVVSKFPEWLGQIQFLIRSLGSRGRGGFRPIEYKSVGG